MKPSKKLLVVGLMSTLLMTGCNKKQEEEKPADEEPGQQEEDNTKVKSLALNKTTLTLEEEASETLSVTIEPETAVNKALSWSSDNEDVAMVSSLGKVRAMAPGHAVITVTSLEDSSIKATCEVTVTAKDRTVAVTGVTLNHNTLSLDKGDKEALVATIAPENATNKDVSWSSNHPEIASVTETGLVEGKAKGVATITVASVADPTKTATCEVTVIDNYIAVNSVVISSADTHFDSTTKTLELQDVDRPLGLLTVTVKGLDDDGNPVDPTDARVAWSVQTGADVVTVSSTGQVTALKVGTATVRATSLDNAQKYDEVTVTVVAETPKDTTVHVDSIEWGANLPESINLNEEANISVTVSPSNTNYTLVNFSLGEGESQYATLTRVSNNVCKLVAVKPGTIHLTAVADDQVNSPAAINATINIVDPITHVSEIELDASLTNLVMFKGDNLDLVGKFTVLPAEATNKSVIYSSSDEEVLLVTNTGKLQARKAGTATVTIASVQDSAVISTFDVRVKNIQVDTIEGVPASKTIEKGDTFQLEPIVHLKDGSTSTTGITYESSDTDVATVSATGLITAKKTGPVTITVKAPKSNDDDDLVSVTCDVTVVDTKPIISQMSKPLNMMRFEQRTLESNMNDTDEIYLNDSPNKGNFFKTSASELVYKVGNKGLFKYNPTIMARYSGESEDRAYEGTVEFDRTLEVKNGTSYVAADTADYVEEEDGIRFNDTALNKEFKLSVTPAENDAYNVKETIGTSTVTFKVVRGYNAYSLAELSLYNNILTTSSANPVDWASYRADHGVNVSISEANDGIVLHSDITVDDSVLPAAAFLSKDYWDSYLATSAGASDFETWLNSINALIPGAENDLTAQRAKEDYLYGACRDYQTLFARRTYELDDNFILQGNFFTIDASNFKQIVKADDESLMDFANGDGSHSQLFGVNVNYWQYQEAAQEVDNVTFANVHLKGNGSIAGDALGVQLAKGSFMGVKAGGVNFRAVNMINHATFSAFLSEGHNAINIDKQTMTLDRCMIYDTYNSSLYVWGTNKNYITNSWLGQSGGPLVLMDEYNADAEYIEASSHFNPTACECTNVYLHNPVHGTEPWFVSHPGSGDLVVDYFVNAGTPSGWIGGHTAAAYAGAYGSPDANARTITGKDQSGEGVIDFIAIDMNASHFNDNIYCQLGGHFQVTNGTEVGLLNMADTTKNAYHTTTLISDKVCPIMGKTSAGGVGAIYLDPGNGYAMTPYHGGAEFAQGNYFSYYLDPWMGSHATAADISDGTIFKGYFFGVFLGTFSYAEHWAA